MNATCCQAIWLARLITELTKKSMMPVELRVDDSSALEVAKNPAFHSRTKHIDVRHQYIRMAIEEVDKAQACPLGRTTCRHND